jgi:hypothetical protein
LKTAGSGPHRLIRRGKIAVAYHFRCCSLPYI